MTPATVLRHAPAGAVLVSRPRGVCHVVAGPLTPSGRAPHGVRPVCRRPTRRLYADTRTSPRVCRLCVAALSKGAPWAATHPTSRAEWLAEFGQLTPFDLAIDAWLAETPEEVERVRYLGLLIVGWPGVTHPVVAPSGRVSAPLTVHLARAHKRVGGGQDPWLIQLSDQIKVDMTNVAATRRADAAAVAADRERQNHEAGRYVPAFRQPA